VDIKGFEANVDWEPVSGLTFYASGNLTDSVIKENRARPNTVGNSSPYTADYTVNAGTQLLVPVSSKLKALFKLDYRLTGRLGSRQFKHRRFPRCSAQVWARRQCELLLTRRDALRLGRSQGGPRRKKLAGIDVRDESSQQEICERCRHMATSLQARLPGRVHCD
jgi:outer membrane receptor protein involved in Fe transport